MYNFLRILVITTDNEVSTLTHSFLELEGHHVSCVADPQEALTLLKSEPAFQAILFDTSRQPPSNLYLLEALAKQRGHAKLWLLAPLGMDLWKADAARLGISTVFHKPLQRHDLARLVSDMRPSHESSSTSTPQAQCVSKDGSSPYVEELPRGTYFLAGCPSMMKIYSTIRLLAPVDVPVLILGESGVGKDIVANLLHKHSLRSQETYLSINCAALPSDLLESELFGYEAGAFTGAIKAKPGKFEMADRGTLLLDEVGEMSACMQAKLLHVLQDGQFSRLGARASTEVDVRVVAATNINIEKAIEQNTFREDLYYRISAFTVTIPPLRERREEIPFLVEEMVRRNASHLHQVPVEVSSELITAMQEYDWPGNLRELSNFVIRILILQDPAAILADLHTKIRQKRTSLRGPLLPVVDGVSNVTNMRTIVRNFKDQTESKLIQEALDAARWNRRHAAMNLKISYRGILYKIQQYQLKENVGLLHCNTQATGRLRP